LSSNAENNKKIAKNTLALYFRQIITMFVSLFTTRIILEQLGVEDFGIKNVVGGVVMMFSFLSSSVANAMNRFFSFELGKNDYDKLHKVFCLIMLTSIVIGIIIVILSQTFGLWWVNNKLIIPPERLEAARWVFHASVLAFFISIINTPYLSLIIAHEKMSFFAKMSIVDVVGKLLVVCSLVFIPFDNLKALAVLNCVMGAVMALIYRGYSIRNFSESKFRYYWDKSMFKEIISYASLSLFSTTTRILQDQGVNILLNMFYGPVVNAARGIAFSVNTALYSFSLNAMLAVNPQIVKSYASENKEYMWSLIIRSSKFYYFILFTFSIPIFLEARLVLQLWLGQVPLYSVDFLRLVLITSLISVFLNPLGVLNGATGKIKLYTITTSCIWLLVLPLAYIFCKNGYPPHVAFVITIAATLGVLAVLITILKFQVNFPLRRYALSVVFPVVAVSVLSVILPAMIKYYANVSVLTSITVVAVSLLCSISAVFFIGLNKVEKEFVVNKISFYVSNFFRKCSNHQILEEKK